MNSSDPWSTNPDPLGEALYFLRMSGTFYCRSELTAAWGLSLPPMPGCLWFHQILSGGCWLEVAGDDEPRYLNPGDIALVPHGAGHCLRSAPGVAAPSIHDLAREHISARYEILRYGRGGDATTLICGGMSFDHPAAHNLVTLLPNIIHFPWAASSHLEWLQGTIKLMAAEAQELRPGGEIVITRLADILVIQAIRAWLTTAPAAHTGWLGALQDPQIGRAIALIHRDPARAWTIGSLAHEVAMSRSAFAARFMELVNEPVQHYIARWRMQVGLTWLREEGLSVSELANRLGYQSEAAFNRAFKRHIGVTPGAAKRAGE